MIMKMQEFRQLGIVVLSLFEIVRITGGNSAPEFQPTVYPFTDHFSEGSATPPGTTLHTFTVIDPDGGTYSMSYEYTPASSVDMFTITADTGAGTYTVALRSGETFDYETRSSYEIKATAFDGVLSSTALVAIQIDDVGEAPTLNPETPVQTFTIDESTTGTLIGHPNFTIQDLDLLETHVYAIHAGIGTGEDFIHINPTNGTINLKKDYDREGVGVNASVFVQIDVIDKFGLSATTTFSVIVNDVNDNWPVYNETSVSISVSSSTAIGTTLATLAAVDSDAASPNNDITFNVDSSDTGTYFEMVGDELKLKIHFDVSDGTTGLSFNVYAVDGGTPARSATATVSVNLPTSTASTTSTVYPPVGYSWLDDNNNVLLLAMIALLAALFSGYCCLMCWRWHTFGQCLPNKCPTGPECGTYFERCCICIKKERPTDSRSVRGASAISFSLMDDRATPMHIDASPFIIGKKVIPRVHAPVETQLQKKPKADLSSNHGKWTQGY